MTDEEMVKQALAELGDIVRCHCDEAYISRGLHDPSCNCDTADALVTVKKHIKALTAERDEHWKSFVHWRKEADALTELFATTNEQLEAARADAKEAEAYAEELEKDLNICRMAQVVMENGIAEAEKERDDYAFKLEKAMEVLDEALYFLKPTESDMEKRSGIYRIVTTIAELKGTTNE